MHKNTEILRDLMTLQFIIGDFTDSILAESLIVRTRALKENGMSYCNFVYLCIILKNYAILLMVCNFTDIERFLKAVLLFCH